MRVQLLIALVLAACGGPATSPSNRGATTTPAKLAPADAEAFGGVAMGLSVAEVEKVLGAPAGKSPVQEEAATGLWVSQWTWPDRGVALRMAAGSEAEAPKVDAIMISAPSKLRTTRGIGIGSSHAEVETTYKVELALPASPDGASSSVTPESIIVGSVYGGTMFHFANGVVKEIFVGAAAE